MDVARLLVGAGGIYASFLYYGSLQEDVLLYVSPGGTKFTYSWFLQLAEAFTNVLCGLILTVLVERGPRALPQGPYAVSGVMQVVAKYTTTAAMVYGVSFPVATLAKASKMVPVMVGSLLLGKARYTPWEYANVALIVGGTVLVSSAKGGKAGGSSSAAGLSFLVASLVCDGVVAGVQKRLKKTLNDAGVKQRNFELQLFTNFYMCLTAALFTWALGELEPGWRFCAENPAVLAAILKFTVCSAVGQTFIFFTISNFDPLVCTTVTTTRKVFSVLLSILLKGHQLNGQGWAGVGIACMGIGAELAQKYLQPPPKAGKAKDL
eukprot:EG_transcript_18574